VKLFGDRTHTKFEDIAIGKFQHRRSPGRWQPIGIGGEAFLASGHVRRVVLHRSALRG
jgi:hypothetical protein